jgi:hypothetical protein
MKPQPTRFCNKCVIEPAKHGSDYCAECEKQIEQQEAAQKANKWLWAGFDKHVDENKRGHYKPR